VLIGPLGQIIVLVVGYVASFAFRASPLSKRNITFWGWREPQATTATAAPTICVVRETPLSLIHLDNLRTATIAGAIICPATPAFYSLPKTVEEIVATVVFRVMDPLTLPNPSKRWGEYETAVRTG
jgi:hypothetical protein